MTSKAYAELCEQCGDTPPPSEVFRGDNIMHNHGTALAGLAMHKRDNCGLRGTLESFAVRFRAVVAFINFDCAGKEPNPEGDASRVNF